MNEWQNQLNDEIVNQHKTRKKQKLTNKTSPDFEKTLQYHVFLYSFFVCGAITSLYFMIVGPRPPRRKLAHDDDV